MHTCIHVKIRITYVTCITHMTCYLPYWHTLICNHAHLYLSVCVCKYMCVEYMSGLLYIYIQS